MKFKFILSIIEEVIAKAKKLTRQGDNRNLQMVEDYIERSNHIEEKLRAKEKISGIIDAELTASDVDHYYKEIHKKHGWQ